MAVTSQLLVIGSSPIPTLRRLAQLVVHQPLDAVIDFIRLSYKIISGTVEYGYFDSLMKSMGTDGLSLVQGTRRA